jgi:hypothetical protein
MKKWAVATECCNAIYPKKIFLSNGLECKDMLAWSSSHSPSWSSSYSAVFTKDTVISRSLIKHTHHMCVCKFDLLQILSCDCRLGILLILPHTLTWHIPHITTHTCYLAYYSYYHTPSLSIGNTEQVAQLDFVIVTPARVRSWTLNLNLIN